MTDASSLNASCLCGAVRVTAKNVGTDVGACHCGMCRKWGGGPFLAIECGSDVSFQGEENISVFDSSQWAERGFCGKCGSHLFYRLKDSKQHFLPAGLFDNHREFVLDHQVFIDRKPAYYSFANQTRDLTEAEVFAMYGAPSE